jgi:hypothetical protein
MKQLFFGLAITFLFACNQTKSSSAKHQATECEKFKHSVFKYKFDKNDDDSLSFTLILDCVDGKLKGRMLGFYPGEELGAFYFNEKLDSVSLQGQYLTFSLIERKYWQKPFNLDNYNKNFPNNSTGGSNSEQQFKGLVMDSAILFTCQSKYYDCYADTMLFVKK